MRSAPRVRAVGARKEALAGYAFVALPMALFFTFYIGALFYAGYISLWDWRLLGPTAFLGVDNYRQVFDDPIFWRAMANTLRYALVVVPAQMALGLTLAVIVNQPIKGRTFFRAAFYFPAIASSAAITMLFLFLLSPEGLFNDILRTVGIDVSGLANRGNWLGHSSSALESIMAMNIWTTSGTMMLFYLASLQTIPTDLYEAAAVDGANAWQTFWRITFPLLKPGHFYVAVVSVIGALQVFDQAYIVGGGSGDPNYSVMTMVLYLYNAAIDRGELGYAAAVGVVLFVLIMLLTLVQRRLFRGGALTE